ncbi:MAG TPA: UDP-N-acetylmuramate dehydrogenase [Salinimicrobium sp.]|nr:UDP-N-acetylmuramate dehydrogenase [Salinimicrobium sp.]
MQTFTHKSLKAFNTFGVDVLADKFISVDTVEELKMVVRKNYAEALFVLGGGSNMLLTKNVSKTVIHINLKGIKLLDENERDVYVEAMAGENWHQFVLWCLEKGYGGLENLSLIPGNVGTAPIQNIGAYGVELKDHFVSCRALKIQTLEIEEFCLADCKFGYRDSIFKRALKGQYIITSVIFRLSKNQHNLITNYGAINTFLEERGIENPGIKDISDAVIAIRQAKLPDPKILGNSGSFFKNPILSRKNFNVLLEKYPEIPHYEMGGEEIKVPAGWLIEKAGLKGYRIGDAGVHKNQALVLVNYGNASGKEILDLAKLIREKIASQFDIELHPEVNIF